MPSPCNFFPALVGLLVVLGSVALSNGHLPAQDRHSALANVDKPLSNLTIHPDSLALAQRYEATGKKLQQHVPGSATTYFEKALAIHRSHHHQADVTRLSRLLALTYMQLNAHDQALKYLYANMMAYSRQGDTLKIAATHSALAGIFEIQQDLPQAFHHEKEALRLSQLAGHRKGVAGEYNNLAGLYGRVDSFDQAFHCLKRAEEINTEMDNQHWLGINYTMYASLYQNLGRIDSVKYYLYKALGSIEQVGHASDSIAIFRKLGIYHYDTGATDSALSYFNKGLRISSKMGDLWSEANLNHWISTVYENIGETQLAIAYLTSYHDLSDSITRQQKRGELAAMRALYEVSQLEDSLTISKTNEQLAQKEIRYQRAQLYTISGIFLLLTLFGLLWYLQLRKQARTNAHLLKLNLEAQKSKENRPKYATSSLSDAKKERILKAFLALMDQEQLYTDQFLKLEGVADRLEVSRTYLSQIINQSFSQNFSAYINARRVQLAQAYLVHETYQSYSIQGVAETVGFRSLSAFNAAFKKETGLTPSYYRKNASQT